MNRSICLPLVAVILLLSASSGMAADEGNWTGWLSDARCATDYAKSATADHAGCAKVCLTRGGKWALSMPNESFILEIDSGEAEQHLGHEVVVKGELDQGSNTIKVSSVSMSQ